MNASLVSRLVLLALPLALVGCGGPSAPPNQPVAVAPVAPPPPPPGAQPPPVVAPPQPAPPPTETVAADVGVGQRGSGLEQPHIVQPLAQPAIVYFRTGEALVFRVEVPQALQLYEASEGHPPRTEEEFFEKVIAANNIQLPQLPPGHRYLYDVEGKQLLVERPAPAPAPMP